MRILALAVGILLIITGVWWYFQPSETTTDAPTPEESVSAPTNFNKVGTLYFPAVESGQSEGTFEYKEGETTTTLKIKMDALSICAAPNGATPCIAMNITFDKPFDGKTALMEGTREGDTILVRKMRIAAEGETLRSFEPGNIFISWPAATQLIEACEVTTVTQTHALDVYLTLKNGAQVRAVEPTIDALLDITQRAQAKCGSFPVGTE